MNKDQIEILRKAVYWAEAEARKPRGKSQWDQGSVYLNTPCGTTYCIAGWVVAQDAMIEDPYDHPTVQATAEGVMPAAKGILGLTELQAEDLFAAGNSIGDVRRISEWIAGEAL